MQRSSILFPIILLTGITLIGYRYAVKQVDTAPIKTAPDENSSSKYQQVETNTTPKGQSLQSKALGVDRRFSNSEDLSSLVDSLRPSSEAGDASASLDIYRAYEECSAYAAAPDRYYDSLRQQVEALYTPAAQKAALAILEHEEARCSGFAVHGPISPTERAQWLQRAAEQGSRSAQILLAKDILLGLTPNQSIDNMNIQQIIITALSDNRSDVLFELAKLMGTPAAQRAELTGPYSGTVEHELLWALVACDHGYPCGPDNPYLRGFCRNQGICQYTSLEQLAYNAVFSPATAAHMQDLRNQLNTAINEGVYEGLFPYN